MFFIEAKRITVVIFGSFLLAISLNFFLINANVYASGFAGAARRVGDGARAELEPRSLRRLRRDVRRSGGTRPVQRRGPRRGRPRASRAHRGPRPLRAEGGGEDRPAAGARLPAPRPADRGGLARARPPPGAEREAARGARRLCRGAPGVRREPGAQPGRGTPSRAAQTLRRGHRASFQGGGAEEQRRRGPRLPRPREGRRRRDPAGPLRLGPGRHAAGLARRVAPATRPSRRPRGVRS